MQDATSFPHSLEACHALIAELSSTLQDRESLVGQQAALLDEQAAARRKLTQEIAELQLTIQKLLARLYGPRRERFDDPAQMKLEFEGDPAIQDGLADAAAEAETIEYTARRRIHKRRPRHEQLPEHLPRYEVIAAVPEEQTECPEHGAKQLIGYDQTETLEFQRPQLRVRVTKYPKFACPQHPECGVIQPERPASLVEGDRYDTSVAAEIIVGKYGFHVPIYRQQDWFAGSGWNPQRSTLLNILTAAAYVLEPLYLYYAGWVRHSSVLATDETKVMLLLPPELPQPRPDDPRSQRLHEVLSAAIAERKSHVLGRMWVYRGLHDHAANVFDFTVSRHRDGPQEFLRNYTGTLLGDCYSGFEAIALGSDSRIVRAACHAHARRKIYEARGHHPREAAELLAIYRRLYDVEDQARGQSPDDVRALRRAQSAPLMDQLEAWLDGESAARLLPKSPLGEAVRYLRNQWDALGVFLDDGRVPFDNNETEQLMKQVATGRKNWLFVGSVEAGHRAAILLTIVSTAHRHHLDVWLYVKDVLDRLLAGDRDYESLRADRWAKAHPEAIRQYRVQEARYRADAKAARRARRRLQQPDRPGNA